MRKSWRSAGVRQGKQRMTKNVKALESKYFTEKYILIFFGMLFYLHKKKLHPNNFFDYYYVPHHRIGERTIRYIKHFLYRCYMYL